jgi:hypothetical protein
LARCAVFIIRLSSLVNETAKSDEHCTIEWEAKRAIKNKIQERIIPSVVKKD